MTADVDPYALYRYFDAKDIELYVGKSGVLAQRNSAHIARSKWMQFAARSTFERYGTPEALATAEREAIEAEHPIFNKTYNNTPEAKDRMRSYLIEAGRPDLLPKAADLPPRTAPDAEQAIALLLDSSLAPTALRIGCLLALGWRVDEIVAALGIPRSTYYDAVRQLTASADARTESRVA